MLSRLAVSLIAGALPLVHFVSPATSTSNGRTSLGASGGHALQAHYQISVTMRTHEAIWSSREKLARFFPLRVQVTDENGRPVPDVLISATCVSKRPSDLSTPADRCEGDIGVGDARKLTNADGVVFVSVVVRSETPTGARAVLLRLTPGGPDRNLFRPTEVRLFVVP